MTGWKASLAELKPIALDDLNRAAGLLTRKDRKYVVPVPVLDRLFEEAARGVEALEIEGLRTFRYESVYFDTPDLLTYRAAARNRPRRFKVRTRTYVDAGVAVLEVKLRDGRGRTVKHRHPYSMDDREGLTADGLEFLSGFEEVSPVAGLLHPALTTRYRRITLLEAGTGARVTIDNDLEWVTPDGKARRVPGIALIETKSTGVPTRLDRTLWALHRRPTTMSKYCTGVAVFDPSLPANRWLPVLRTFLDPGRSVPYRRLTQPAQVRPAKALWQPDAARQLAAVAAG